MTAHLRLLGFFFSQFLWGYLAGSFLQAGAPKKASGLHLEDQGIR